MASRVEIAFAVGRRAGGAVVRNRIRRRLRAIVHEIGGGTAGDGDGLVPGAYLFGAGPEAATIPYEELRRTVTEALRAVTSR
jgi:RNase P protein component